MEEGTDKLQGCCGQLLATNRKCEHTFCDGVEEAYRVGGLSIELEKCPHPGCDAWFYASPTQNLQHQDSVHCGVLAFMGHVGVYTFLRGPLCTTLFMGTMGQQGLKEK